MLLMSLIRLPKLHKKIIAKAMMTKRTTTMTTMHTISFAASFVIQSYSSGRYQTLNLIRGKTKGNEKKTRFKLKRIIQKKRKNRARETLRETIYFRRHQGCTIDGCDTFCSKQANWHQNYRDTQKHERNVWAFSFWYCRRTVFYRISHFDRTVKDMFATTIHMTKKNIFLLCLRFLFVSCLSYQQ